jgi:hypothetical protein
MQKMCFCCKCCVEENKVYKNKVIEVNSAPNPDSIKWENNDSSGLLVRRFISFIVTVGLLVACNFLFIIYIYLLPPLLEE